VPYALRRSGMEELEATFSAEMAVTRASRTRQSGDFSFVPYLYHHYGHHQGRVRYAEAPASFVTIQNFDRPGSGRALRSAPFVCFQDSRGSATDEAYRRFRSDALEMALPLPSSAEQPAAM
jgi:hypothetical protein